MPFLLEEMNRHFYNLPNQENKEKKRNKGEITMKKMNIKNS